MRAFFVHPDFARLGVARRLLERCEAEAARAGFLSMTLVATLTGVRFYAAVGYVAGEAYDQPLPGGIALPVVPMDKTLRP
ncbi:MAG TPA: GNAT family N-acetyltransferase [Candidatus Eisenbacteria bacterium]